MAIPRVWEERHGQGPRQGAASHQGVTRGLHILASYSRVRGETNPWGKLTHLVRVEVALGDDVLDLSSKYVRNVRRRIFRGEGFCLWPSPSLTSYLASRQPTWKPSHPLSPSLLPVKVEAREQAKMWKRREVEARSEPTCAPEEERPPHYCPSLCPHCCFLLPPLIVPLTSASC